VVVTSVGAGINLILLISTGSSFLDISESENRQIHGLGRGGKTIKEPPGAVINLKEPPGPVINLKELSCFVKEPSRVCCCLFLFLTKKTTHMNQLLTCRAKNLIQFV
jgi:hypothetical protein